MSSLLIEGARKVCREHTRAMLNDDRGLLSKEEKGHLIRKSRLCQGKV